MGSTILTSFSIQFSYCCFWVAFWGTRSNWKLFYLLSRLQNLLFSCIKKTRSKRPMDAMFGKIENLETFICSFASLTTLSFNINMGYLWKAIFNKTKIMCDTTKTKCADEGKRLSILFGTRPEPNRIKYTEHSSSILKQGPSALCCDILLHHYWMWVKTVFGEVQVKNILGEN